MIKTTDQDLHIDLFTPLITEEDLHTGTTSTVMTTGPGPLTETITTKVITTAEATATAKVREEDYILQPLEDLNQETEPEHKICQLLTLSSKLRITTTTNASIQAATASIWKDQILIKATSII